MCFVRGRRAILVPQHEEGTAVAGLDQFERFMERMVEGSVSRVFRSQVQEAEIGRRLEQAMESRPMVGVGGTIVPNDYHVHLHPEDAAPFQSYEQIFCETLAGWLVTIGEERGYRFVGPVRVALVSDGGVRRRDIQVQAVTQAEGGAQQSSPPPPQYAPPVAPPGSPPPPMPPSLPPPQAREAYQSPPAPRPEPREAFTVRQERSDRPDRPLPPPEAETALASERSRMVAPVAGVPALPPQGLPPGLKGTVAYFALRASAGERSFPLRFVEATLGRALDNEVVLESNDVSRRHARLEPAGSVLRLVDLGSTNGTRVNGRRVAEHLLREGDLVELGSVQLIFHVGDPNRR